MKTIIAIILCLCFLNLSVHAQTNWVQRYDPTDPHTDFTLAECFLAGLVLTAVGVGTAVVIYVHWKFKAPEQGEKAAFVLQRQDFPGAPWVNVCTNIAIVDTNLPPIAIYEEAIKTNKLVEWRCKCFKWTEPQ